jgi:hypothetical protein
MPGIFHNVEGAWRLAPVVAPCSLLRLDTARIKPFDAAHPGFAPPACLLVRVAGPNKWAALVPAGAAIRHNGVPVAAGLRMLAHRDALALEGGDSLFFTTEEPAHIEVFAGPAVPCPRCRLEVLPGDASVRCPACGVVHHESPDRGRPCWSYAEACSLCPQTTALDAGLAWTPEDL